MENKNLIIIGASYLQLPLIKKARELGFNTHVFAWKDGMVGEEYMTKFYDISITEIDKIYDIAKELNPVGVCTIGSDLANVTVQDLARRLNLCCNSERSAKISTNKFLMRQALSDGGVDCPKFILVDNNTDLSSLKLNFPVIVKPTDRSGSRAIFKVENEQDLKVAIDNAIKQSFEKKALVEEFIEGDEYSIECVTQYGEHHLIAITKKFTTEAPNFIETGHLQPSGFTTEEQNIIEKQIFKALSALEITTGVSHSEFRCDKNSKKIKIIEIASRGGGDFIASHLVKYSTGYDFVQMIIDCAVGNNINDTKTFSPVYDNVCVKYCFNNGDINFLRGISENNIIESSLPNILDDKDINVTDSSSRIGYAIMHFDNREEALQILRKK